MDLGLLEALPVCYREVVTPDHCDQSHHLNIRWYFEFFSEGTHGLWDEIGIVGVYRQLDQATTFALKHHLEYKNEILEGQRVRVHGRVVGRSEKRFHWMLFLVNETNQTLAAVFEGLVTNIDLGIRRTAPFPETIRERIDKALEAYRALDWEPPLCGAIRA